MEHESDPPIVGIGASAGGVEALQVLFDALPDDTGAAFVVILHLDPEVRSDLALILRTRTGMPVSQVEDGERLRSNCVYVIAPNRRLRIADHTISSLPFSKPRGQRAPIDLFFRSLAEQHGDAIAMILTGAGADGTIGVKAVKEAGGIVLVQDPREAAYQSMPRSAIATGVADFVLPIRQLAERLVELLRSREQLAPSGQHAGDEDLVRRILGHVRARTGHDFSQYKRATILRRIARRAQVNRQDSLTDYYNFLCHNVEEVQALFNDFLISVTTFFRDPKSFETLARIVIPDLFDENESGNSIRVWVPGCATGEEAYTIGMLLLEEARRHRIQPEIQVFGSDLDSGALAIAREGRYPATIEADLSEERLRRFFSREGDHYRVRRELRDILLFASHSLLRDPPFSRLHFISCRNLLIYLDRELQQQVCSTFRYALNPAGYLFVGPSESADQPPGLFRILDRDARIYRALAFTGNRHPTLPVLLTAHPMRNPSPALARYPASRSNVSDAASHRQMLEKVAPPSASVDHSYQVIHLSENAGRYMQPSGGSVSVNAIDLIRPELRFELRAALHRAFERGEETLTMPILVKFNGAPHRVYLLVRPIVEESDPTRHALIMFIDGGTTEAADFPTATSSEERGPLETRVAELQDQLQLAHSRLRTTREEAEATNEELRAANEELQSINEEYRSTSEELETSKEELQSINEELQTVNNELKIKLETVSRAHSDLQNFMAATDVATLFLDTSLRIKRFTPRLFDLFNITANDEGRPITDFTHQLEYDGLAEHARHVLRDLTPVEHEIKSRDGGWYLVRIRPYRTIDDKIDGVVATFVGITERRRAEEALRESEERLRQEIRVVEVSRAPIFVWDFDGGILEWNRGSEELYGYPRSEAVGKRKDLLLHTQVPGSSFDSVRRVLVEQGMWSGELVHRTKDGRQLTVESHIELVTAGKRRLVLESTRNITDHKLWEKRQQLLLSELTHRVKNTLAVVQSLARQTLRTTGSRKDLIERFEGRLAALAAAYKLLVETDWQGAEIGVLARSQLNAYAGRQQERLQISGQAVMLPPDYATPFGLVLHELATNAAKYGALSSEAGRVALDWQLDERKNGHRHLTVVWKERDGPPVTTPQRRGFGTALIGSGVPGSSVRHEFRQEGVVCTIEIDLPAPGEADAPG